MTVCVVGGGIAGLVTAWQLATDGYAVHLLEAGPAVGGCIARHTVGGLALDAGAESFATASPAVADLIHDLGLGQDIVAPNPLGAWVRHAAGTAPLPLAALLGIPAHPLARDVRRVLGPAGALRAALDLTLPVAIGADRSNLGALVRTRMGRRVVDRLVEPVAGGVYSTDPDELEVDSVQPLLRATLREQGSLARAVGFLRGSAARPGSAVAGLRGGLFELVTALERSIFALGGRIDTATAVTRLQRNGSDWDVHTTTGSVQATDAVLAVPGPAAAELLAEQGIIVPETAADTSDVRLVTLVLDHHGLDAHPRGTGVLVSARAAGVTAKALTHATAKWEWLAQLAGSGRHVLRLSYGRGAEPHHIDPDALLEVAAADAAVLTGIRLDRSVLLDSAVVTWSSALPRPQPGHRAAMTSLLDQVAAVPGLHLTGSMTAGTGLAAVVGQARATARRLNSGPPNGATSATTQAARPHPAAG